MLLMILIFVSKAKTSEIEKIEKQNELPPITDHKKSGEQPKPSEEQRNKNL